MSRILRSLAVAVLGAVLISPATFADNSKKSTRKMTSKSVTRVERDVNRLEALLLNMNSTVTISDAAWKRLANEANMLANRIYANTRSARVSTAAVNTAQELRTHVRMLHKEAHEGDVTEARQHAREALPFAYRLDDMVS